MTPLVHAIVATLRLLVVCFVKILMFYLDLNPYIYRSYESLLTQIHSGPMAWTLCGLAILLAILARASALARRAPDGSLMAEMRQLRKEYLDGLQKSEVPSHRPMLPSPSLLITASALLILIWLIDVVPTGATPYGGSIDKASFALTLWPVHTAVFSVSAAVITFVVQSASSKLGVNLIPYFFNYTEIKIAVGTGLLGFVSIGVMALLPTIGLEISLGAIVVNLCLAITHLVSVISTLRIVNMRTLQAARSSWIEHIVTASVEHDMETRIAINRLQADKDDNRLKFSLWTDPPHAYAPVRASVSGRLGDINIRRLNEFLDAQLPDINEAVHLKVYPGKYLKVGDPLFYVPPGADVSAFDKDLKKIFLTVPALATDQSPAEQLRRVLSQIRDEAYQALEARNPGSFDDALDSYEQVFQAVESAVAAYGAIGRVKDFVSDWNASQIAFMDWYSVLVKAVRTPESAIISKGIRQPLRHMERFLELNDLYNFRQVLGMYLTFYSMGCGELKDSPFGRPVADAWEHLFTFSEDYLEERLKDPGLKPDDYRRSAQFLWHLMNVVCDLGKRAVDVKDAATIKRLNAYLDSVAEELYSSVDFRMSEASIDETQTDLANLATDDGLDAATARSLAIRRTQYVIAAIRLLWCTWATDRTARGDLSLDHWNVFTTELSAGFQDMYSLSIVFASLSTPLISSLLKWEIWETEKSQPLLGRVSTVAESALNMEERAVLFYVIHGAKLLQANTSSRPLLSTALKNSLTRIRGFLEEGLPTPWSLTASPTFLDDFVQANTLVVAESTWNEQNRIITAPFSAELVEELVTACTEAWRVGGYGRRIAGLVGEVQLEHSASPGATVKVSLSFFKETLQRSAPITVKSITELLTKQSYEAEYQSIVSAVAAVLPPVSGSSWLVQLEDLLRDPVFCPNTAMVLIPVGELITITKKQSLWHSENWVPAWKDAEPPVVKDHYVGRFGAVPVFESRALRREALVLQKNAAGVTVRAGAQRTGRPRVKLRHTATLPELLEWNGLPSLSVEAQRSQMLRVHLEVDWTVQVAVDPSKARKLLI